MTPDPASLPAGTQVGPYRIRRRIGVGGMGVVYAAVGGSGIEVALKVTDASSTSAAELVRFEREYRALVGLDDPHVVRVFDAGRERQAEGIDLAWLAMELVEGGDLESKLATWRAGGDQDRFDVARQVVSAIASALVTVHGRGLVHRDIKPSNILFTRDGTPKLADFGIVKSDEYTSLATHVGRVVGTVAYLAPEVLADDPVDARTDLYGLGAVLYTMLTLRRPIEADSLAAFLARHLMEPPAPPRELDPHAPADLERLCLSLLSKLPELRPRSASEVLRLLHAPVDPTPRLFGREAVERATVEHLQRLSRGLGGVLWIVGPAGSGRTAALAWIGHVAAEAGRRVRRLQDPGTDGEIILADDLGGLSVSLRARFDELARGVGRGGLRLLVAATDPAALRTLRRADAAEAPIALTPLGVRSVGALLRDRGVVPADASVLAARMATPEIWPGVVVELLEALTRSGALVDDAVGGWYAPEPRRIADDELPPPERVRKEVLSRLARLDADTRELVEVLAVFGRPVGAGLVARSVARPARVPMALDALVASGLLVAEPGNDDHALRFAWPGAGVVVRAAMASETVATRHLAAAAALQRQRWRDPANLEVATHLAAGGKPDQAAPLFARAATASLAAGKLKEALRCAEEGLGLAAQLPHGALPDEVQLELAAGRAGAMVALGRWPEARDALVRAVALAPQQAPSRLPLLAELGFVLHRVRAWDEAERVLEDVLAESAAGEAAHERAVRVLADVRLCRGDAAGAAAMLEAAVQRSQGAQQARVRRGLANVYVMRGELARSAQELAAAEVLLPQDAEPTLRASVLARQIDLDLAAGRVAAALRRAEVLVDHTRARGLVERCSEALALLALSRASVGQRGRAVRAAEEALEAAQPARAVRVLPAIRVLLEAGARVPAALVALQDDARIDAALFDPYGQLLALRARALVTTDPAVALELVRQAIGRPAARLVLARAFLAGDAAETLVALGMPERALSVLDALEPWPDATEGLQLDVLALRARAGDRAAPAKVEALAARIAAGLDGALRETFRQRWQAHPLS